MGYEGDDLGQFARKTSREWGWGNLHTREMPLPPLLCSEDECQRPEYSDSLCKLHRDIKTYVGAKR